MTWITWHRRILSKKNPWWNFDVLSGILESYVLWTNGLWLSSCPKVIKHPVIFFNVFFHDLDVFGTRCCSYIPPPFKAISSSQHCLNVSDWPDDVRNCWPQEVPQKASGYMAGLRYFNKGGINNRDNEWGIPYWIYPITGIHGYTLLKTSSSMCKIHHFGSIMSCRKVTTMGSPHHVL